MSRMPFIFFGKPPTKFSKFYKEVPCGNNCGRSFWIKKSYIEKNKKPRKLCDKCTGKY